MDREFDGAIPNARVAVKDVTYAQAIDYKEEIEGVESVTQMVSRTSDKTEQALVDELKKDEDIYYLARQGVSTYDLMDTITADMLKVNLVAIGAVFHSCCFDNGCKCRIHHTGHRPDDPCHIPTHCQETRT